MHFDGDITPIIDSLIRIGGIDSMSHSIAVEAKPENYVEMVKAIREYVKYPLELD